VIDASAVLELLLKTQRGGEIEARALAQEEELTAPELLDIEVTQGLRRLVGFKELTARRGSQVLQDFLDLRIKRFAHVGLLERVWQLRDSMTAYDAAYVALAEVLDVALLTCDTKLGRSHGHRATIEVVK
jgi:predicted nucleic acid-binding protein